MGCFIETACKQKIIIDSNGHLIQIHPQFKEFFLNKNYIYEFDPSLSIINYSNHS